MNKLQELENELLEQQSKLTYLQSEIEKLKQAEQGNQLVPSMREKYWVVGRAGGIDSYEWTYNRTDNAHYAIGNVFRTKGEADFEVERRKVITELKKFSKDYEEGKDNYYVYYSFNNCAISYYFEWVSKRNTLYFPSEEIARQAVQAVGEDRVKKYYLGVTE